MLEEIHPTRLRHDWRTWPESDWIAEMLEMGLCYIDKYGVGFLPLCHDGLDY
jgi:hypothetical protein